MKSTKKWTSLRKIRNNFIHAWKFQTIPHLMNYYDVFSFGWDQGPSDITAELLLVISAHQSPYRQLQKFLLRSLGFVNFLTSLCIPILRCQFQVS